MESEAACCVADMVAALSLDLSEAASEASLKVSSLTAE